VLENLLIAQLVKVLAMFEEIECSFSYLPGGTVVVHIVYEEFENRTKILVEQ
jgi:hypothetical protein